MKKLLVVVDYQKDFVNGALGFDGAERLDAVIADKIRAYKSAGDDVVVTYDTHGADYLQTQEGKNLPIEHCIKGTGGWELFGETAVAAAGCPCFEKPTFGSAALFDYLRERDYAAIELCGLVSNICVISNAVLAKTALPEAEIVVDAKATASFDEGLNEAVLAVMRGLQITVNNL